jgi:hypothetical protein
MTRLLLGRGDLTQAVAFEQERAANADDAADAARVVDRLTSARLLHAQGRHREALPLLEELGETAEAAGRTGDLIEILALQALALWEGSKKERAVSTLAVALALAAPEGYVRTFVDEGQPMAELLSEVLEAFALPTADIGLWATAFVRQVAAVAETSEQLRRAEEDREREAQELSAARVIQQQLLPKELPSLDGASHPTTSRRVLSAAIFTISLSCPTANSRSSPATSLIRVSPPPSL